VDQFYLKKGQSFNLDLTLGCGQVFRWYRLENGWKGYAKGRIITIRSEEDSLFYAGCDEKFIREYFQLDMELSDVVSSISLDPYIKKAVRLCQGLRIIHQDPWECLISFICSSNANIPMIEKRIELICSYPPDESIDGEYSFAPFPEPEKLAQMTEPELMCCKAGYRARYLIGTAKAILNWPDWKEEVKKVGLSESRKLLCKLPGVGPKVAECVLLFGFNKYEAFPVDVWIRRLMEHYPECKGKKDEEIGNFGRKYFSSFPGYAQQYLYAARKELIDY